MVHLSGGEWVVAGVMAVVGSVIGYLLSENDRRTLGRTPWGLPSLLWALFWFLSLLLGLVLYLIAHSSEVRRAQHGSPAFPRASAPIGTAGPRTTTVAEQFPAYPRPANLPPEGSDPAVASGERPQPQAEGPGAGGVPSGPEAAAAAAPAAPTGATGTAGPTAQQPPPPWISPPGWHPDPSGRFHYRWWDGYQWTSHVSTDGHYLMDTNPDQRIGPYH